MRIAILPVLCMAFLLAQTPYPMVHGLPPANDPPNKTMAGSTLFLNMGGLSTSGYSSQDFETFYDLYDSEGANDVVVPSGQTWFVDSLYIPGQYYGTLGGSIPCDSAILAFYTHSSGPGSLIQSFYCVNVDPDTNGNFTLKIPGGMTLTSGHYWFSVRARMNLSSHGQWGWNSATTLVNDSAHWRNPGAGFATTCNTNWNNIGICLGATQKEFAYAMYGCIYKDAGTDNDTILCTNSGRINLNTLLSAGSSSGGLWTDMAATGALSGPFLTTGLLPVDTFVFRYSVGNYVCADTSFLTIYLIQGPRAGNGDTIAVCNTASPFSLYGGIAGAHDTGGVFIDIGGSGAITDSLFDPSIPAAGLYQVWYYLTPTADCPGDTSFIYVQVDVCTGLDHSGLSGITLYPNPTDGLSMIDIPQFFGMTEVTLTDLAGRCLRTWNFAQGGIRNLDMSDITSGYYLVKVQHAGEIRMFRLTKQ